MAKKITPKQLAVLAQLAEPKNLAHYSPYMGRFNPHAYWYVQKSGAMATREIEALLTAGLIIKKGDGYDRATATINQAGREYLKQNQPEERKAATWWSISKWDNDLKSKEFFRDTESCLFDEAGRKTSKSTDYETWLPTREAATEAIRHRLNGEIENLEKRLVEARKELAKFERQ